MNLSETFGRCDNIERNMSHLVEMNKFNSNLNEVHELVNNKISEFEQNSIRFVS